MHDSASVPNVGHFPEEMWNMENMFPHRAASLLKGPGHEGGVLKATELAGEEGQQNPGDVLPGSSVPLFFLSVKAAFFFHGSSQARGRAGTYTSSKQHLKLQSLRFVCYNTAPDLTVEPREGKSPTPPAPLCHRLKPRSSSPRGPAAAHWHGEAPLIRQASAWLLIKFPVAAISKHICRGCQDII